MRKTLVIVALTLPIFFLLQVVQAYHFEAYRHEVQVEQSKQQDWLDRNKRLVGGITVLSSPGRIDDLARNVLKLSREEKGAVTKVIFGKDKKTDG